MLLTKREREVAEYVRKGYTNKEIAQELYIDISTVKAHVSSIMRKYNVRNRTYLAYILGRESVFEEIINGTIDINSLKSYQNNALY